MRLQYVLLLLFALCLTSPGLPASEVPTKIVVLTFDDAVKTQITNVAPLLKELGFHATFFISQRWMDDKANFLTWEEVGQLHRMGFEIGNHSWTHSDFSKPENAAKLGDELEMVEKELARVGVPKPVSFAWCGNSFGPEALEQLQHHGYKIARRGMQPEIPYGALQVGPALDVSRHHPLLVPTTGDAYPGWTLEHFKRVLASVKPGEIAVFQFHGVPDIAHPWVNTPIDNFRQYMSYLKGNGFRTMEMRELLQYYDESHLPQDPLLATHYPAR